MPHTIVKPNQKVTSPDKEKLNQEQVTRDKGAVPSPENILKTVVEKFISFTKVHGDQVNLREGSYIVSMEHSKGDPQMHFSVHKRDAYVMDITINVNTGQVVDVFNWDIQGLPKRNKTSMEADEQDALHSLSTMSSKAVLQPTQGDIKFLNQSLEGKEKMSFSLNEKMLNPDLNTEHAVKTTWKLSKNAEGMLTLERTVLAMEGEQKGTKTMGRELIGSTGKSIYSEYQEKTPDGYWVAGKVPPQSSKAKRLIELFRDAYESKTS